MARKKASFLSLISLNQEGFFLSMEEEIAPLYERAEGVKQRKYFLNKSFSSSLSFYLKPFDLHPSFLPIRYETKGLRWHEMAVTWIDPVDGYIQLRPQKGSSSFYPQEEIVAHEAIHWMRSSFASSPFEEILAYQTSSYRHRRFLGSILCSQRFFSLIFISCLMLCSIGFLIQSSLLVFSSLVCAGALLGRSLFYYIRFLQCKRKLLKMNCPALAVMVRLTAKEILWIAKTKSKKILSWIEKQKSVRWQVLRHSYFTNCAKERTEQRAS